VTTRRVESERVVAAARARIHSPRVPLPVDPVFVMDDGLDALSVFFGLLQAPRRERL